MKKRILFLTVLLVAVMVFAGTLLAESGPVVHLIERGSGGGGCFETATASGGSIPDNVPSGACWDATMGGAGSTVLDVSVDVAATHTWIGDLEFWLNSPDGSTIYMLDRPGYAGQAPGCCGDSSDLTSSAVISFADGNTYDAEQMGATILGSEFVCQTDGQCDFFPNPDGAAGSLPNFAGFAGENTAGTWQFCAADNAGADTGNISSFTVNVTCSAPAAVAFTKTVGTDPNVCATTNSITIPAGGGGTDVTYCYYMTNTGGVTVDLHTVTDDQLGTVLGPDFPASVGPGGSAWFTLTTLITQTTVNSATWSATDATGGNGVSASDTATVTQGAPTDVSLSSFGSDEAALSPVMLAGLFAIILGFGLVLRRRWIRVD